MKADPSAIFALVVALVLGAEAWAQMIYVPPASKPFSNGGTSYNLPAGAVTNIGTANLALTWANVTNILKQVYPTNTVCITGIEYPSVLEQTPDIAYVGQTYSYTITKSSTGTTLFSLASGTLPPGLTLESGGSVNGPATSSGESTVTVQLMDGNGFVSSAVSLDFAAYYTASSVAAVVDGGQDYTNGDVVTVDGGSGPQATQLELSVTDGVVTGAVLVDGNTGHYLTKPSNPVSVSGGTGSGATFTLNWSGD